MQYIIDNCSANDFEFVCPKKWAELRKAYVEGVRHCDQCSRKVYLCKTDADIRLYDSLNYCIAIIDTQYEQRRLPAVPDMTQPVVPEIDHRIKFVGVYASVFEK